jgi:hypothetical protein
VIKSIGSSHIYASSGSNLTVLLTVSWMSLGFEAELTNGSVAGYAECLAD